MREIEADIIEHLNSWLNDKENREVEFKLDDLIKSLFKMPFSIFTVDFIQHENLKSYLQRRGYDKPLQFWYLIAQYLLKIETVSYDDLVKYFNRKFDEYHIKAQSGLAILPRAIHNHDILRSCYLSGDKLLLGLLQRYLPKPRADFFKGTSLPDPSSHENEKIIAQSVRDFLERHQFNLEAVEPKIIKIQRIIRKKQRLSEEKARLTKHYKRFLQAQSEQLGCAITSDSIMHKANSLYIPKGCSRDLAARIVAMVQNITLYSTIRHLTSSAALSSIFDNALYGRRTLLQFYLPFKPATLKKCDITNGDGNVVCFGMQEIDPLAGGDIELILDLPTVIQSNPSAFFKVIDLAYADKKKRYVKQGNLELLFSATQRMTHASFSRSYIPFQIFNTKTGDTQYYTNVKKCDLIAYDLKRMNQLLTLSFFRYIDALFDLKNKKATTFIAQFYSSLAEMDDIELECFLKKAALELTKTAEFNFYGAYQLDFSALKTINVINGGQVTFSLDCKALISSLEIGSLSYLQQARSQIPTLFTSYRFLNYLLSNTRSIIGRYALQLLRAQCNTPSWIESIPEPEPLTKDELELYTAALTCPITAAVHAEKNTITEKLEGADTTPVVAP